MIRISLPRYTFCVKECSSIFKVGRDEPYSRWVRVCFVTGGLLPLKQDTFMELITKNGASASGSRFAFCAFRSGENSFGRYFFSNPVFVLLFVLVLKNLKDYVFI